MFFVNRLTPDDLGLAYESMNFQVDDRRSARKIRIAAWWMAAGEGSSRTAILVHGYGDAKVGSIAWAPLFRSLGFNVLAIDLRAHGDSEGAYSTGGFYEREDLTQVIDQLRASRPEASRQVVLLGLSLGAAVVAAAAGRGGRGARDDLAAVILECPFADFPGAILSHADNLGVPGSLFQMAAIRVAQWISGSDFGKVKPVDTIPKIRCPLWVIQSECDPFVSARNQARVAAAVAGRGADVGLTRFWRVEDCHHIVSMAKLPAEYRRRLEAFLEEAGMASEKGVQFS
jgi:alpha-beta hydrolase superfamily lysophospholipase